MTRAKSRRANTWASRAAATAMGSTRDARGRWLKGGASPNPSGRPPTDHELQELARAHTRKAIETLVKFMDSEDPVVAIAASKAILERGHGKPAQSLTLAPAPRQFDGPPISDPGEAARVYQELMAGLVTPDSVVFADSSPSSGAASALPAIEHQDHAAVPVPLSAPTPAVEPEPASMPAQEPAQAAPQPELIPGAPRPLTAQEQREQQARQRRVEFEQQLEAENERARQQQRERDENIAQWEALNK